MKISVYGSGYVGLVVAACLAEAGNEVVCMDVNAARIALLNAGKIPIYEPGLESILHEATAKGMCRFTTGEEEAVLHGEYQFIAVGTPPDRQGKADLRYVLAVAQTIARYRNEYTIVINKSTVPLGTADKVHDTIQRGLNARGLSMPFDVVSNPEFLKEGAALDDFRRPDRIIVGVDNLRAEDKLRALYAPFIGEDSPFIVMDKRSAELTKYASNAMLATKISFMNEMANLAEQVGADIEKVRQGMGADRRIGHHFTHPGCGYGGSCFGKDIQALIHTAQDSHSRADIIQIVEQVNVRQKWRMVEKMEHYYQGDLRGKTFAVWGLAFKPQTDDMRDAPSVIIINALLKRGATIQAFDPQAMEEAKTLWEKRDALSLGATPEAVLEGAHALIILTEWAMFKHPDFRLLKQRLLAPVIFDGRNLYDPVMLDKLGFIYHGIGRGRALKPMEQPVEA